MSRDVEGLARRLYLYAFLDDFVALYPVYALLFADTGLSTGEISGLFVVWSVTSVLLEVPSGVLADSVSRRLLLAVAPLLAAAGFGLWVLAPSYWVFAAGFVLWGAKGALRSGTVEALVYEELLRLGAAGRYTAIMGRAGAATTVALVAATGVAAPVVAWGGYSAAGWSSVVALGLCAVVGWTLPDRRAGRGGGLRAGLREYAATLRAGLGEVRGNRSAAAAVLLVPAVAVLWGDLEEYTPLLASGVTDDASVVAGLMVVIAAGTAIGGVLSGRFAGLSSRGVAGLLVCGAAAMAAGAGSGRVWGFGLIAVSFAMFEVATVVSGARLQDRIRGEARSTVTSVSGLLTDVGGIAMFAGYGVAAGRWDDPTLFVIGAAGYLPVAAVLFWNVGSAPGQAESSTTGR